MREVAPRPATREERPVPRARPVDVRVRPEPVGRARGENLRPTLRVGVRRGETRVGGGARKSGTRARALGADVDGDEGVGAESRGDGGSRGGKKGSSSSSATTMKGGPHGGGGGGGGDGFDPSLPRGTVSGADALTEADEDAHEDPGRVDPSPRSMPPAPPRGGPSRRPRDVRRRVRRVLPRTAEFRCMCDESRARTARGGAGRGAGWCSRRRCSRNTAGWRRVRTGATP